MKRVISLIIAITIVISTFVVPASAVAKTWTHCLDTINDVATGTTPSTEITKISSEGFAGTNATFKLQGWVDLNAGVTSFAISKDKGTTWETAQFEFFDRSGEFVQGFRVFIPTADQTVGAYSVLIAAVIDDVNYEIIDFSYNLTDPNVLTSATQIKAGETKLTQDITGYLNVTEGTYVIDLAGFTWSHDNVALQVEGTADVKIIDSSENKTGKIIVSPNDAINAFDGTLTIDGVTVEANGIGMDAIFVKAGTVTVKDSILYAPKAGIDASQSTTEATIIVDGVTFAGHSDVQDRECAIEFRSDNKNVTLKGDIKFSNNTIIRRDDCTKELSQLITFGEESKDSTFKDETKTYSDGSNTWRFSTIDYKYTTTVAPGEPTIEPTVEPTAEPTIEPTVEPTAEPTIEPTVEPTIEPTVEPTIEPTVEPTAKPTESVVYPCVQTQHDAYAISTIISSTGYYLQSVTLDKSWVGIVFPGWASNNDGTATFEIYEFDTDLNTSVLGEVLLSETISIKEIPQNEHRFEAPLAAGKYVFKISNLGGSEPHFGIGDKVTDIATDIAISEVAVSEEFDTAVHALIINYITSGNAVSEPTVEPTANPTVQPTIEPTVEPTANPTVQPTIEPTAEPTAEPTNNNVLHVSYDEIKPGIICGGNEANISTPVLPAGTTEATFWGWVALAKNVKSFSYSINGGAKVDQPSAVVEAEQPVLDAAATVDGAITASRFSVVVPVTEGTQKIEIFAEFEDGTSESFWVADLTVGEPTDNPSDEPTDNPSDEPSEDFSETIVYPCVQTHHDAYAISTITSTTGYYLQSVTLDKSWVGIVFPGWAVNNDGTATFEVYAFNTDLATSVAGTALLSETISIKEIPENEHRFANALPAGKYVFKISNLGGSAPHFGIGDKVTDIATDIAISEVAVSEEFDPAVHALIINYIISGTTVDDGNDDNQGGTEVVDKNVLHVSHDEVKPDVICGNNEVNISTPKLETGRTEATFWGWVALAKNIKSFSYSINGGAKVDQPSAVVEAEQPVLDAAATVDGAITASRFSVVVPVTEGTQKIEIFAEFEDGTSESFWVADLTVGEPTDNPSVKPTPTETVVYPCVQTHHDAYAISTITSTTGYYLQSVTLDKSWVGIVFPGWAVNNDGTATFEVYAFNTDLATSVAGTALLSETISIKEIPENEHRFAKALPAGKYVFKISNLKGANPHFGIGDKVTNIATDIAISEVAVSENFDPAVHALIINYIVSGVADDTANNKTDKLTPLSGSNVVINNATISGIAAQTTAANVVTKFEGSNFIRVVDKNGNVLSGSALVGTGCKVQLVDNGTVKDEATIIIKGDIDGNGKVDSDDAIYLLRNTLFASLYPVVTEDDVDGNGKYDSDDAIHLLRYTLFPSLYPLK